MKLEAGKLYKCRDDELFKYARVDAIRPETSLGLAQVAVTWFCVNGRVDAGSIGLDGHFLFSKGESERDLIEEYVEPDFIVDKEGWYLTAKGEEVEVFLPHTKKDNSYPVLVVYGDGSTWFVTKLGVRYGQEEDCPVKYLRPRET